METGITKLSGKDLEGVPETEPSIALLKGIYRILSGYFPCEGFDEESARSALVKIANSLPPIRGLGWSRWDFGYENQLGVSPLLILRLRTDFEWWTTHQYGVGVTQEAQSQFSEVWLVGPNGECLQNAAQRREYNYELRTGSHFESSPLKVGNSYPRPEDLKGLLRDLIDFMKPQVLKIDPLPAIAGIIEG